MKKTPASSYAHALYQKAVDLDLTIPVHDDMSSLLDIVQNQEAFRIFLKNKAFNKEDQKQVLRQVFHAKVQELSFDLILLLIEKERIELLSEVCQCYVELFNDLNNILTAQVISHFALNKDQIEEIQAHLSKKFDKEIIVNAKTDATLIGGVQIIIGHKMYDYSIKSKLDQFKHDVIHA